ncbi:MAG: membrane protein insertion efficiency factor YidD [Patescibacteria group bacterium]|nr:membrane protein insertion efficiency factor YidD [Patescibacteria group bacterium]
MKISFRYFVLYLIKIYQQYFSPERGYFSLLHPFPGICKFRPTCSEYAAQAIEKHGFLKGLFKTIIRILRCHPFSKGGWDPVK